MPRKRRYTASDGKDWRDPNMQVSFSGKVDGVNGIHEIPKEHIQQYYAAKLKNPFYNPPTWRNDPSYWWNRKKQ